jgi:RNA polymerase sigma factor (sigma-70 family)
MDSERDEYQLALQARSGDRGALAELVERSRPQLFAIAYAELYHYEDAQDAVAAAMLRVCRSVHQLQQPERLRAWMQTTVRNEARRLARRRRSLLVGDIPETAEAPGEESAAVLRLDVEHALRQLPRDEARCIALYYLSGLPVQEIVQRTGRPPGTVRRWLHQGRRHLSHHLEVYAPMTATSPEMPPLIPAAALVATQLSVPLIDSLCEAMRAAFWEDITTVGDVPLVEPVTVNDVTEFHLALPLRGRQFIILDDWIGGHSAFELLALLKATQAASEMLFCLLTATPEERTLWAAWIAGFDVCVAKPVDLDEFQSRCTHAYVATKNRAEDPRLWAQRLETHRKAFVFAPLKQRLTQEVHLAAGEAFEVARQRGQKTVDTEHLLLGLLGQENNATRLLTWMGVDPGSLRSAVEQRIERTDTFPAPEEMQVRPLFRQALESAEEEARRDNERYVGTVHLLLGLLGVREGQASELLIQLGVKRKQVQEALADPATEGLRREGWHSESFSPPGARSA